VLPTEKRKTSRETQKKIQSCGFSNLICGKTVSIKNYSDIEWFEMKVFLLLVFHEVK
jgi:hypothetical protein